MKRDVSKIIAGLQKKFGKESVVDFKNIKQTMPVISTGMLSLDMALGVGGWPCGRIIELFGKESGGKTTMALCSIAHAQKDGRTVGFIDAENSFDFAYAELNGCDTKNMIISQPDTGEEGLAVMEEMVSLGVHMVVVDSVASLVPRAELEGQMGDSHVGLQARMMSQALRKVTGIARANNTVLIFINQLRAVIGGMGFGPKTTTPGGHALKHYASIRVQVSSLGKIKQGDIAVGQKVSASIVKSKVAPPGRKTELHLYYDEGLSLAVDIINLGLQYGVIKKSGSWLSMGDDKLAQGINRLRMMMNNDRELMMKIKNKVLEQEG